MNAHVLCVSASVAGAIAVLLAPSAQGQWIDPRRPTTLVVGEPRGPAPMDQLDGRRESVTSSPLPIGPVDVAWHKTLGAPLDHAPLVVGGEVIVVTSRGEVVAYSLAGDEIYHSRVLNVTTGPPVALPDGAIVFTTPTDVVFVRGAIVKRASLGSGRAVAPSAAPLPLDDGGVVVTRADELIALDRDANVRARAAVDEAVAEPLIALDAAVAAVTVSGQVWSWTPGREPRKMGDFGGPLDGAAARLDANNLLAVVASADSKIVELDLEHGTTQTWAALTTGLFAGPPAISASVAYVTRVSGGHLDAVGFDMGGRERQSTRLGTLITSFAPDAGAAAFSLGRHPGPIVDTRGNLAIATPDGNISLVSSDQTRTISAPCGRSLLPIGAASHRGTPVVGVAPAGPGALAVACEGGSVLLLTDRAKN